MNPTLQAKRELRTKFMNWAYNQAEGSELKLVSAYEFLDEEGVPHDGPEATALRDAIKYLEGEYLIKPFWTLGGLPSLTLTHAGAVEVEQAMMRPDQPTEHFVPVVNITTVHGNVVGSQIQQGSPGAKQSGTITVNQYNQVREFIEAARQAVGTPEFDPDDREKVVADLTFMEKELERPEPRWDRLKALALAVQSVVIGGLGDALGVAITSLPWHHMIASIPWA